MSSRLGLQRYRLLLESRLSACSRRPLASSIIPFSVKLEPRRGSRLIASSIDFSASSKEFQPAQAFPPKDV